MPKKWEAFEEVEKGDITDASFVANIWRVYKGDPDVDERYSNPEKFFERTFISEGLESVLKIATDRVFHGGGEPVVLLRTTFGGGKTHTLIAIYHTLIHPELAHRHVQIKNGDVLPVIVAFDGVALDPQRMREYYGANNLWQFLMNEIAAKTNIDEFEKISKDYSDPRQPPGSEVLREAVRMLEERGYSLVLLLDEIPDYISKLSLRDEKEARATIHFLDSLSRAISECRRSMLVITIPEVRMLSQINEEISNLVLRIGRVAIPKNIVGKGDAAHVLRQALIKNVDTGAGVREVDEYYRVYSENSKKFPANTSTGDYLEKMRAYYPFHPQYIEVLYEKVASLETFQSTRDILRLTAHVLFNLCRKEDRRIVLLSDISMVEENITAEFLERHGFENLKRAIEADIEYVRKMDEEAARKGLPAIHIPVYSAIAVFSVAGEAISVREIALATVKPEVHPYMIDSAINFIMSGEVSYIHPVQVDGETRYIIRERASWRRLVELKSAKVSEEDAKREFIERFNEAIKSWGRRFFSVITLAKSPKDIKDEATLRVVLIDPDAVDDEERTIEFFTVYADPAKQELRKFRNSVVYILPNLQAYSSALDIAKKIIAALRIRDARKHYGLTGEDVEEITKQINTWRDDLKKRVAAIYSRLAYPIGGKNGGIKFDIKSLNNTNPIDAAASLLKQEDKVLEDISELNILKLIEGYYETMGEDVELKVKDVAEFFARDLDKPYILNSKKVVSSRVSKLVEAGKLVLIKGENAYVSRKVTAGENDVVIPGDVAAKKGLCVEYEDGVFIPSPPSGFIRPKWDETAKEWVDEGAVIAGDEGGVAVDTSSTSTETEAVVEIPTKPTRKIELESTTLPDFLERLKQESGEISSISVTGEPRKDATNAISFIKSMSVQLKEFKPDYYITAEVGDGDKINLKITGELKSEGVKEVLSTLERLGCRSFIYEITMKNIDVRKLLEKLDVKLLREKYRSEKFDVKVRMK